MKKKISQLMTLCFYTIVDNIRQRLFYTMFLFGVLLFGAAGLLSAIGGEQRLRVLKDLGIFSSEFIALITTLFLGTSFFYDEIENRSIYLILTRPVKKSMYIIGRYLGVLLSTVLLLFLMYLLNLAIVGLSGGEFTQLDIVLFIFSAQKIAAITTIAIFFTILTTSKVTAMSFTFFIWLLGHFSLELDFLSKLAASGVLRIISFIVNILVPHLYKFSLPEEGVTLGHLLLTALYTLLYVSSYIIATVFLFRKKEF